ncbi:MAG: hypothetical protein NTV86_01770 [Planctomycetota bacterium]|nr:hypothetical protein [Planctomycetota bacterium]
MAPESISTKKLLIAFDPSDGSLGRSDFLVPISDSTGLFLYGTRSMKPSEQGVMVYLGKDVTINDLFARLVDSGRKIEKVSQTLEVLAAYLHMLQQHRIGNVLAVESCGESPSGFRLIKIANSPPAERLPLP